MSHPSDTIRTPIEDASAAIATVVASFEEVHGISAEAKKRVHNISHEAINELTRNKRLEPTEHASILFLQAKRYAEEARRRQSPADMRMAIRRIVLALVVISRASRSYSKNDRLGALEVARLFSVGVRVPKQSRQEIDKRILQLDRGGARAILNNVLDLRRDQLDRLAERLRMGLTAHPEGVRLPEVPSSPSEEPSAADLIANAADRQAVAVSQSALTSVAYDLSEVDLRVRKVTFSGFRGSPQDSSLPFVERNQAASAIIFGENGVGKSTITDAIEFALQGRLGRSTNFDSPLGPALRSIASNHPPVAAVELTDGTTIRRTARDSPGNVLMAEPTDVRPGFRLAPITIKRSDILQFLDTEALERGSTLLDYFPADAESLALRPADEIHRAKAEMTELRIKRQSYASELADALKAKPDDLLAADSFKRYIRQKILGGISWEDFELTNGWDDIPERTRFLIAALGKTHNELRQRKKIVNRPAQILNPIKYNAQTVQLRSALEEVGAELTSALARIGHDYPLSRIDVVFGESGPLSLDIVVRLNNGTNCFPQQLFSEAYRDLIALLFFVSVAKKASLRGQARILILDDVLQSVDATIRHAFMDYLLDEFPDWQLIVTVHDRLWREQLRDLFHAHDHSFIEHRIESWSFEGGLSFSKPNSDLLTRDLRALVGTAEPRTLSAIAGQVLEAICDQLTRRLHILVPRKDGDRYTLGDLWPTVCVYLDGTSVSHLVQRINTYKSLRNITVHSDSASLALTSVDARGFAQSVLQLYESVHCSTCGSWLRAKRQPACQCGRVSLQR
ncbi:AAA family ATPase [Micromonospora sp. DT233]|uniref:ATP-binding protein n=1 Tax=Micromonospora sp. DT233 TaxID=3393432 RepID=UPI003CEA8CA2